MTEEDTGLYAVEHSTQDYFDPSATDDQWPGVIGLNMRTHEWWQGDEAWDTYEALGPSDESIYTQPPDGSAPLVSAGPGGLIPTSPIPGSVWGGSGFTVNGVPVMPCDEDGIAGSLVGMDQPGAAILLQGVYSIGDLLFPVPPETLTVDFGQDNDFEPDIIGLGEITIPGTMKLETVGWESFFPSVHDTYVVVPEEQLRSPQDYAVALIWTKRFRMPCRLIIDGTPWNEDVIIKTFSYTIKAGEPDDLYYNIGFKRFRTASVSTVQVPGGPVDPRDYPSFQGIPTAKPDPTATVGVTDPTAQDDGTQNGQVPLVPEGPPEGPLENRSGQLIPQPGQTRQVTVVYEASYWTGLHGLGVQSLEDVYDDLVSQGLGDLNTMAGLVTMNKSVEVMHPAWETAHTIGQGYTNSPIPIGTELKYNNRRKETVPVVWGGGNPAPDPDLQAHLGG